MSGWVRFDNTTPENLKVSATSDKAFRLWFHATCYCSRAETDGLVPEHMLNRLGVPSFARAVEELVDLGLFVPDPQGYRVNDYLDFNPSRDRLREMREGQRKRSEKWRDSNTEDNALATENERVIPHARDRSVSSSTEREIFEYWQRKCNKPRAKFTSDRRQKVRSRLREGYSVDDIRLAIDNAAVAAYVNDAGKRFDDIELICRNGSKLESFMTRAPSESNVATPDFSIYDKAAGL